MAVLVYTDRLNRLDTADETTRRLHVYNGLDCCVTHEIAGKLKPFFNERLKKVYDFEMESQGPALTMMRRGVLVDDFARVGLLAKFEFHLKKLEEQLNELALIIWNKPLNANSPKQLKEFFYYATPGMHLQEQKTLVKGKWQVSTNRECLEKLKFYFWAEPVVNHILGIRDLKKRITVLKLGVDPDGRMRFSFNPSATETGRWSSSTNAFGGGTNAQNIIPEIRQIFIADHGYKLAYLDLEQAESRVTAYEAEDLAFIAACESGDLHTYCAGLLWPEIVYGADLKEKKKLAELKYIRHFSYRDMSKRGGHACNYMAKPWTISRHLKIPVDVAEAFQSTYFGTFPGIPEYHRRCARELMATRKLITALGRERIFFGRPDDETVIREAVAYRPQSTVADILNRALIKLWRLERELGIELLLQVHDAILYQYPEHLEDEIVPHIEQLCTFPIVIRDREMTIPVETKVGYMWYDDRDEKKLEGRLEKWSRNGSTRKQIRPNRTALSLLDHVLY